MVDTVKEIQGFQTCNYSAMAALCWTVYDMVLSIRSEYEHIWKGNWTNFKTLYLVLRWFTFSAQLIAMVLTLNPIDSPKFCAALVGFQAISSQVLMFCVQLILILRVIALYYEHAVLLKRVLLTIYVAQAAAMTALYGVSAKRIQYAMNCSIVSFPDTVVGYLLIPMIFETFLFGLTMWKFWTKVRSVRGQETLLARFIKDGIWAFALPFSILLANTLTMAIVQGSLATVAFSWVLAISGYCGSHLLLNLSHLLRPTQKFNTNPNDTLYTEGALDSFPLAARDTTYTSDEYSIQTPAIIIYHDETHTSRPHSPMVSPH